MKIQLTVFNKILIFFAFFFIGFYRFDISLALFVVCIIWSITRVNYDSILLKKDVFSFLFILITFYCFLVGFGGINGLYNFQYYSGEILAILTFLFFGYIVFYLNNNESRVFGFIGFLFGLFSYSIYCLWYTKFVIGLESAYSKVWNPYSQAFDNSPSHAMNIGLMACLSLFILIYSKSYYNKILFFIVFLTSVYYGLYTGSRFFIILIPLSFFIYILFSYKLREIIKYLSIGALSLFCFLFFLTGSNSDDLSSIGRVMDQGFDDSGRFKLIYLGLINIVDYPFGGYIIDRSIYVTAWNHNIFFDIARIGGLIPTILFLISLILLFKIVLEKKIKGIMLYMLIVVFLIFQQDVIFTGNYMLFLVYTYASYIVVSEKLPGSKVQ